MNNNEDGDQYLADLTACYAALLGQCITAKQGGITDVEPPL